MTWLELFRWLQAQEELLDMRPPQSEPPAKFLKREAEHRAATDAWIEARYFEERDPPLNEELRRWVGLRLLAAIQSIEPEVRGLPDATIDQPALLRRLLLTEWPRVGLVRLRESVTASAPSGPAPG